MAQQLRALTALPGVLSSIPSNHMVAHNHLYWDPMPSSGVSETATVYLSVIYIKPWSHLATPRVCFLMVLVSMPKVLTVLIVCSEAHSQSQF